MGGLFAEETAAFLLRLLVVIIAFGGGGQRDVAPGAQRNIATRHCAGRFCGHVPPGNEGGVPSTDNLRALLTNGLVNLCFILRLIAVAGAGGLCHQVYVTPGLDGDVVFCRNTRRLTVHILTGGKGEVIPGSHRGDGRMAFVAL